jgi:hypothetical protein
VSWRNGIWHIQASKSNSIFSYTTQTSKLANFPFSTRAWDLGYFSPPWQSVCDMPEPACNFQSTWSQSRPKVFKTPLFSHSQLCPGICPKSHVSVCLLRVNFCGDHYQSHIPATNPHPWQGSKLPRMPPLLKYTSPEVSIGVTVPAIDSQEWWLLTPSQCISRRFTPISTTMLQYP